VAARSRYILLTPERVERATGFFERQGPKIVTIARFVEGLRQANGIIAGIGKMRWLTFLAFNALGAALWVALWTSVGDLAGSHIATIYDDVTRYFLFVLAGLVVLLAAFLLRRRARHRRGAGARATIPATATVASSAGNQYRAGENATGPSPE
jgi:membrane protein DedA with SNARE-associated domain